MSRKKTNGSARKTSGSAQKVSTTKAPSVAPTAARVATHEDVAARAYGIWEASGRQHGCDCAHWYQAERELRG